MKYQKSEFVTVPNKSFIRGLAPNIQVLFFWLCEHSDDNMQSFPSRKALAEECGMSVDSVDRGMRKLVELGLIRKSPRSNGHEQTTNLYEVVIKAAASGLVAAHSGQVAAKPTLGGRKTRTRNSTHLTQPIELKGTNVPVKPPTAPSPDRTYRTLFAELVAELGFSNKVLPTEGRLRKLKTRNRTFKYDELITAAKNLAADPFMQGDNESGKRYGTIDYFLRSDESVAKYLELGEGGQPITEGAIDETKYL